MFFFSNLDASETNLPSFATPPLGQFLYEEVIPPVVQDWLWCKLIYLIYE